MDKFIIMKAAGRGAACRHMRARTQPLDAQHMPAIARILQCTSCYHVCAFLQVTTDQALEALQREASKQVQGGLAAEEAADLQDECSPGAKPGLMKIDGVPTKASEAWVNRG
eukprot:1141539-Pelagomonas_calceolata.AAC.4